MTDQPDKPAKPPTFTGRGRQRTTRPGVKVADGVARVCITMGGVGTILAVMLVCIFLIVETQPLFNTATVSSPARLALPDAEALDTAYLGIDEYRTIAWAFSPDGTIRVFRADDGTLLDTLRPLAQRVPTCWTFSAGTGDCAFGFADGTIQLGKIGFEASFVPANTLPDEMRSLAVGTFAAYENGIVMRTAAEQYRRQALVVEMKEPLDLGDNVPIIGIDQSVSTTGNMFAALSAEGHLHVGRVTERTNWMTMEVTLDLTEGKTLVPFPSGAEVDPPRWVLLAGLGDNVFIAWQDGRLLRYDTRSFANLALAEEVDLVPEPGETLTALEFLIGKATLVSGDSRGRLAGWFRVKPDDARTIDGATLVKAHELEAGDAAVTALAISARTRKLAAGYADGQVRMFNMTNHKRLARLQMPDGGASAAPVAALTLAPKDDALLAAANRHLAVWDVDAPHPEVTVASIFTPVWYEGYNEPTQTWQSSSGTDEFEPKYGLYPLVFGTIKATFYSMLFGVPLALLAAVYTSEFMHPRTKARVKPTIELMASLPSVVLGFLAALVIAPFVEGIVPQTLATFFTVPFALLLGAFLWQMIPRTAAVRFGRHRVWFIAAALPMGLFLAFGPRFVPWLNAIPVLGELPGVGRLAERLLFGGDLKAWLTWRYDPANPDIASPYRNAAGGWMLLFLPLSAVLVAWLSSLFLNPWVRRHSLDWSHPRAAGADMLKFLFSAAATVALAMAISSLLNLLGFDPRGSYLDTYDQRNAMIVGLIMGFAIIPIIYTISEDALSAVPDHLRAASLGAGATPWQTAVRIIIPTAMSGLFSAVMIGFGRAVGETMIVLMAAGNTPVLSMNIFEGFRTLSANIAVELPEAVQGSTHYRMLFLAALTLFAMTFALNTVAEVVRLRFRRRAFQL